MNRKIKLIICDLDGILVDAYNAILKSINYTLKTVGLPAVDYETIRRHVGWGEKKLIQSFIPANQVERVLAIYREHHKDALKSDVRFLPGAKELLDQLRSQKYRLAIASNRPARFTQLILRYLNIESYFHCVLCGDKVSRPKPSGVIVKDILKKCSLKPSEALYVGDMAIDIECANRAQVKSVAVLTGSSTAGEIEVFKPLKMVGNIYSVLDVLNELG